MPKQQTAFENIVGKGEIALNEQFLLFHNVFFYSNQIIVSLYFVRISDIVSLFAAKLEDTKIGTSGKGLNKIVGVYNVKKKQHPHITLLQQYFCNLFCSQNSLSFEKKN